MPITESVMLFYCEACILISLRVVLGLATLVVSCPMKIGRVSKSRGGTPLYKVYRYVPPQRVWFLSRFGQKTGIDFEHFGLKLGMVIGGTFTKAYNLIFLPSDWGE